jgi:hypothetical protein
MYSLMADAILTIHFVFIVFVVVGQACIVAGFFRNWQWVRDFRFRLCHILSIGVVVAQAWVGKLCLLTVWECTLREAAGQQPYTSSFVEYWVGRLVYFDAPTWAFTAAYSFFGVVVLWSWFLVGPGKGTAQPKADRMGVKGGCSPVLQPKANSALCKR